MAKSGERPPTRGEFRREVIAAFRAAGFEGPFDDDRVFRTAGGGFDLHEVCDAVVNLPAAERVKRIETLVRGLAGDQPRIPLTWDEAKGVVMLAVKPRIALVADQVRRERGGAVADVPSAELSPHLVLQVVLPQGKMRQAVVGRDLLEHWGVEHEAAFEAAGENMRRLPDKGWGQMKDAPGVHFSAWKDGYDAARLAFPQVFRRVALKGAPVALALSPSALAFAGSEDEEGLFHLARKARWLYEQSKTYLFLRPTRLTGDGLWEDGMPPKGHGAHEALRLLEAINEVGDYQQHAAIVHRAAEGKDTPMPLPALEIVQGMLGGETVTVTTWSDGPPRALPKADGILLQRGEEVLGFARWEDIKKALPGSLEPLPGYPTRYLAADFPEGWQIGMLDLKPWERPK